MEGEEAEMSFRTKISHLVSGSVDVRNYALTDIIRNASAVETMFLLLAGRRPDARESKIVDAVLACCAEHGFVNTASVAGRYVMSGSGQLPAALAAGILAFGQYTGTAHLTAIMLADLAGGDQHSVTDEALDDYIAAMRARREVIPGFGHPLHKETDPREAALRDVAEATGFSSPNTELLDRVGEAIERCMGRKLVLNVDGLIGSLLMDMGLDPDSIFAVNILGAMPGIAAHAIEERTQGIRLRVPPEADTHYEPVERLAWHRRP